MAACAVSAHSRGIRAAAKDCEACEAKAGLLDRIDLDITFTGPITPEQHAKLMEVAARRPVHRTLKSEIDIQLREVSPT